MIKKARLSDAKKIHGLVDVFAKEELMLPRSIDSINAFIRDFFVWEDESGICGCVALNISSNDLAEIRSLAVAKNFQKKGIGAGLIEASLAEAKALGIKKVFALTYKPAFFKKFGFKEINKADLPHKIWNDCVLCSKFPGCAEIAMMKEIK